jgi:hypothetical protein
MANYRSLLKSSKIERAIKQRKCTHNKTHCIKPGEKCLVIKEKMKSNSYCINCTNAIIQICYEEIKKLELELN